MAVGLGEELEIEGETEDELVILMEASDLLVRKVETPDGGKLLFFEGEQPMARETTLNIIRIQSGYVASERNDLILCEATSGAFDVFLPKASLRRARGRPLMVKKTDGSANAVTVKPLAGDTIDGVASAILNVQGETAILYPDGGNGWESARPVVISLSGNITVDDLTVQGKFVGEPDVQTLGDDDDTIDPSALVVVLDIVGAFPITSPLVLNMAVGPVVTATGAIEGQLLLLTCRNDETNFVQLPDDGVVAGSGLNLGASFRLLSAGASLLLRYDPSAGAAHIWNEIAYFHPTYIVSDKAIVLNKRQFTINAAGDQIPADAGLISLINATGGPVTLTGTPTIALGFDGQILKIVNDPAPGPAFDSITFQHDGDFDSPVSAGGAGSKLRLAEDVIPEGVDVELGTADTLQLIFRTSSGCWHLMFHQDNQ